MSLFLRSLALCNAFLLVLPQGWCCFLPVPTVCTDQALAKTTDCCHCSNSAQQKPEASDDVKQEPKAPTPEPVKPVTCCCQPDALAGPNGENVRLDLGPAVPLIATAPDLASVGNAGQTSFGSHSHSPPLQLLHCVWLC